MLFRTLLIIFALLVALFFDIVLGSARVPILTLIVCGIVVVYEIVSPFIYTSR